MIEREKRKKEKKADQQRPILVMKLHLESPKTHNRLNERFLSGRNRTKRANFRTSPLFQATYNLKTEKQTINSTYLVSVRCSEAGGRKRARD